MPKHAPKPGLAPLLDWNKRNQSSVDLQHQNWRNNSFISFADRKTWWYIVVMLPGDPKRWDMDHYVMTTRSKDAIWEKEDWEKNGLNILDEGEALKNKRTPDACPSTNLWLFSGNPGYIQSDPTFVRISIFPPIKYKIKKITNSHVFSWQPGRDQSVHLVVAVWHSILIHWSKPFLAQCTATKKEPGAGLVVVTDRKTTKDMQKEEVRNRSEHFSALLFKC